FNQVVQKAVVDRKLATNGNGTGSRPGDLFAAKTTWPEVIEPHGWVCVGRRGNELFWRRPGKGCGFSATTNFGGSDLFYVFSTSAYPFEHETSYSKFAAHTLLNYGGDYRAAARAIARQYGMADERPREAPSATDEERQAIQQEGASGAQPTNAPKA